MTTLAGTCPRRLDRRGFALSLRHRWPTIATVLLSLLLVVQGWVMLAPTAIGGPVSYVVTDGTSMLPHFKADGLVVTRAQHSYHVGEVVAYHNRQLHVVVMHRIVARDGNRYVFKGDNNNFRDLYHPTRADLVGKEWLYVPDGGRYLQWLRSPAVFALILGLIGWIIGSGFTARKRDAESEVADVA